MYIHRTIKQSVYNYLYVIDLNRLLVLNNKICVFYFLFNKIIFIFYYYFHKTYTLRDFFPNNNFTNYFYINHFREIFNYD